MLNNLSKIIVVVGCQRSGTTLLGQILGAHPNAMMIDETDRLYDWFPEYVECSPEPDDKFAEILQSVDRKYRSEEKRMGRQNQITHLVLKAPNLTYSYELIARLRVPVSIVYPVRDVRSVVASMSRLAHIPMVENQLRWLHSNAKLSDRFAEEVTMLQDGNVDPVVKRAIVWKIKSNLRGKFEQAGLTVFSLKYEDLVTDCENICCRMIDQLELNFSNQLLHHETIYEGYGPGGTDRSRPIDRNSLDQWKKSLTTAQEASVMQIAEETMDLLGYQ